MGHKVVDQLTADGRYYDGRQVIEILRAIRNVAEHWFQPRTAQEEAALEVRLTRLCLMACYAHVCMCECYQETYLLSIQRYCIERSLRALAGVDGRECRGDTGGAGDSTGGGAACCGDREGVSERWRWKLC